MDFQTALKQEKLDDAEELDNIRKNGLKKV